MKLPTRYLLIGLGLWCLLLLGFRAVYWHSREYFFLPYNLFLAAIPLVLSHLVARKTAGREKWIIGLIWLLFFPNAPYILTDLVRLSRQRSAPIWYDAMLLLSFGGTGAAYGYVSLSQMQNVLIANRLGFLAGPFAIGTLFLASFGIYLGRVIRLNSWDVLVRPFHSIQAIAAPFINPSDHLSTWAMTIGLGVSLSLGHLFLTQFTVSAHS